jgi:hypothetical protein
LLATATQRQAAQRRASSPLGVLNLRVEGARASCRPSPHPPQPPACWCCAVGGLLCTDRRCTAPPCSSRGGRAAREGAALRAICSACHGARARGWAHWSMGTLSAAARAGGRARVWSVRSGRAREPPSLNPFQPHSGSPPDRAAAALALQPHSPHKPPARARAHGTCGACPHRAQRTGSGPQSAPLARQAGVRENWRPDDKAVLHGNSCSCLLHSVEIQPTFLRLR